MANEHLRKYRSIKYDERSKVLPGDTLYLAESHDPVTVKTANPHDCTIILNGEDITVSWDSLMVLD